MSVSTVFGSSETRTQLLLSDLRSSARTTRAGTDDTTNSRAGGSGTDPTKAPASIRDAIEDQLAADVAAGTLSEDDADLIRKALDSFEETLQSSGQNLPPPPAPPGGQGRPDSAEMFSSLDTDGDGTLTREEFVSGRPESVTEEQATALYESLAETAGTDSSAGLSAAQFSDAMSTQGPPAGGIAGGPPPGGGGGGGGGSDSESEKTEISRTTTTNGSQTTTIITYSDGSTETTTEAAASGSTKEATNAAASAASQLMTLLQDLSGTNGSRAAEYLRSSMTRNLFDIRA